MPRGFDHDIRKQVDMNVPQENGSYPKGRCIHCDKIIAVTASTIKRHLKGCSLYNKHRAEHPELHPESTELTPRRSTNKAGSAPGSARTPTQALLPAPHALAHAHAHAPGGPGPLGQQPLPAAALNDVGFHSVRLQVAKDIFVSGKPFGAYSGPETREVFRMLAPGFRPPGEDELAGELLDAVYDSYLARVRSVIDGLNWLNISLDAPEDAGDDMVVDVCVATAPGTQYYWTRVNTGAIEVTASNRLQLLRPVLADITGGQLNRIMSFSMTTENMLIEGHLAPCPARARLSQDRINKLMFIYYNHRVLKQKQKSWSQLTEHEIEEAEGLLFEA